MTAPVGAEVTLLMPAAHGNFDSTLQDQPPPDNPRKTREQLQFEYWSALTSQLASSGSYVRLGPPKSHFGVSAPFAHPTVRIFSTISLSKKIVCSGIRTLNQKELYTYLSKRRKEWEREIERNVRHPALDFHWTAEKRFQTVGEIRVCFPASAIHDRNSWGPYLVWHQRTLEALNKLFYKRVRTFNYSQPPIEKGSPPAAHPTKLVNSFWKGFQSSIRDDKDLTLNKPSLSSSPFGKSSMSKTYLGFRFAVQIHPARDLADVNVTVGQVHHLAFAKLRKSRESIHKQLRKKLEWKLNDSGESWALVSRDFQVSNLDQWEPTYIWLKKNLRLFLKVMLPRIQAIQDRIEKQNTKNVS
ncbi:MAG TPA: DUF4268 domain-containing protein [Pyrinomonadaceae bacterium]|nr:DUF4268 domain-containing protein [Pyrinomonadaceae bacterium]